MAKKKSTKKTELSYGEAVTEIEGILSTLESNDNVDIDKLADQVELASAHIQLCFSRLKSAEARVQKITTELEEATSSKGEASSKTAKAKKVAAKKEAAEDSSELSAEAAMADQFVEDDELDAPF